MRECLPDAPINAGDVRPLTSKGPEIMAKLSISEASRVAGVARSTLHRAINQGRLSLGSDGKIDTAELLRLGYTLHPEAQQVRDRSQHHATPAAHVAREEESPRLSLLERERDLLQRELALLQRELDAARGREGRLLGLLEQMQQRFDRLLPASEPTAATAPTPKPQRPHWPADVHESILDFMRTHPGPHTPGTVQDALGLTRTPRHLMRHMLQRGMLRRSGPGRFMYPDETE